MVVRVRHVDGEYRVVLTPEAVEALHLQDGTEVEILPVTGSNAAVRRYATTGEVLKAFRDTLPDHENTYRELAK